MKFDIPILVIAFNRPQSTKKVFDKIRELKPKDLCIAVDGPRNNNPEDLINCENVRDILSNIDWECNVKTLFRDKNLGCKMGVSSSIDWFFQNVEEGIILEDDCIPDPSFFQYCAQLLKMFRDDNRIFSISGSNTLGEWKSDTQDYHFTQHVDVWGWASWRRAWKYFDIKMEDWSDPDVRHHIKKMIGNDILYKQKMKHFNATYGGKIDTWDHQWVFAHYKYSALSIVPSVNLISNIGFGIDATHTKFFYPNISNKEVHNIHTPLRINPHIVVDRAYDIQVTKYLSSLRIKNIFGLKFLRSVFDYLQSFFR
ncbi:MAG: hypothetical protein NTX44_10990 [Ignavibacteriales bacterium]|nr:hypothetical protein [Ignavibacteriales bacterium]